MPVDLIGKIFGSYKLVAPLGRGGMASVYKGYQESIDRTVAVKVLPPEFLHDPNFSARFTAEARVLAKLTHPAILPLYDFGTANDVPYIVMPLMANGTLTDKLSRGPLPLAEISRLLTPIAAALDYAHKQGVLHRDVKPSNILFDQHDAPFLGDFGIAKALEASSNLTGTGVVGTPDYMSPEQARGEPLDGRSDIYSLGAVVYQTLTGQQLFRATTPMGVMLKHATEPPPPVRGLRPDLPQAMDGVLQKALAKYPKDRYQTATEFARALAGAIAAPHDERTVYEPPADTRTKGGSRRQPTAARTEILAADSRAAKAPPAKPGGVGGWLIGGGVGLTVGVIGAALAVVCLCAGLIALGMAVGSSTPTPPPPPTNTPRPPTPTPVPYLLYDNFTDPNSGWSTFSSDNASARYVDDSLALALNRTEWFVWSNPGTLSFSNVHVEVTARPRGGGDDTSFGLMCSFVDNSNYYYMGIDPSGRYAIVRYDGKNDLFLTGSGKWASSGLIPLNADSYRIGGDCGGGVLALYVDGSLVDSAADSTLSTGNVGLFAWTNTQSRAEIRFTDFGVTELR